MTETIRDKTCLSNTLKIVCTVTSLLNESNICVLLIHVQLLFVEITLLIKFISEITRKTQFRRSGAIFSTPKND